MYLAKNHVVTTDYPSNSNIPENDWHILAGFWHPVAFVSELSDKPHAVRLLDMDLVVYKTVQGFTVAKDQCAHRGSKLSLGWMDDKGENIVCPFHGHHYNEQGNCTLIPSYVDESKPIPAKMCLQVYQSVERYGLIWA